MTPPARRVAVTGVGAISALGHDAPRMWAALCDGRSGIAAHRVGRRVRPSVSERRRGEGPRSRRALRSRPPGSAGSLRAVRRHRGPGGRARLRRRADAGLRERTAVFTGSSLGGQTTQDAAFVELYQRKSGRVHPLSIPRGMANAGASQISMDFGLTGPVPARSPPRARPPTTRSARPSGWCASGAADLAIAGRKRGSVFPGSPEGLGGDARRLPGHVPAIFPRSPRTDSRRGRRDARARAARGGPRPGSPDLRRALGLRHVFRRPPRHAADGRGSGARDARRARRCGALRRAGRLHQRPRHGNARQRLGRGARDPGGLRRPRGSPRRQLDQVDARTRPRSGRRPGSGRDRARPRRTGSFRRPPISPARIPSATSTSCPTVLAPRGRRRRSRTPSRSEVSTRCSHSARSDGVLAAGRRRGIGVRRAPRTRTALPGPVVGPGKPKLSRSRNV